MPFEHIKGTQHYAGEGGEHSSTSDSGLVSYWKFDGDAIDATGRNNGTVSGATSTRDGLVEKAYDFDGDNDYIDIPTITLDGNYSASFW